MLDELAAVGEELTVSSIARAARVDRSFLYRHHDLRAQIITRAEAPNAGLAATTVSKRSLLADLANLRDQNQRLRRQNTKLASRLSEALGDEVLRDSRIGRSDETGHLRTQVSQRSDQANKRSTDDYPEKIQQFNFLCRQGTSSYLRPVSAYQRERRG